MTPPSPPQTQPRPLIEFGWILAGNLSKVDAQAALQARNQVRQWLQTHFERFEWRMPLVTRAEMVRQHRVPPVVLLDAGAQERDNARWDFCLVITESDLDGHYKPFMLAAPSQALGVAVISTARLDPAATNDEISPQERQQLLTTRLASLAHHLFGHLNDLPHHADPQDFMFPPSRVDQLETATQHHPDAIAQLHRALERVADVRLEETGRYQASQGPSFFLHTLWHDRTNVLDAAIETRPWLFPFLLSKLTTAAVSTLVVMINTAEAWDLGMSQTTPAVVGLSIAALLGTTAFVIKRQHLLSHRQGKVWSEQRVISTAAISLAMLTGMATLYAMLFAATLLVGHLFFSYHLIEGWAASIETAITFAHHLRLAGFIASMGLLIGALGAAFEAEEYIRHVTFVDEET